MLHSHKPTNSSNIHYKAPHTHFYTRALANCLHGLFAQYVGWEGAPKEGLDAALSHGCPSSTTDTAGEDDDLILIID